jgi:hypothetical protein
MFCRPALRYVPMLLIMVVMMRTSAIQAATPTDLQLPARADSLQWAIHDLEARVDALQSRLEALNPPISGQNLADDPTLLAGRNGAVYVLPHAAPPPEVPQSAPEEKSVLEQSKVEISGYLDGVYSVDLRDGAANRAALHQVDIDLARELNDRASVGLSVYYEESLYIAAATIAYSPYKAEVAEGAKGPFVTDWTATAGQFDIPFGLDYQVYTSIARETITMPAVVAGSHGGWNDAGLMNTITTGIGTLNLIAVKGFESRVWNGSFPLPPAVSPDNENWAVCSPSVSGAARLNFTFVPGLQYGGSFVRGWSNGQRAMTMSGVHTQASWKALSLKAEGIYLRKGESICPELVRGSYLETMQTLGKFYLVQRYDYLDPDIAPLERYISAGAGIHIGENLICRGEYRVRTDTSTPQLFFQVAAGF